MENLITLIKRDHEDAAELISEVRAHLYEERVEEVELRTVFEKLMESLVAHLNAEEEAVYSKLKERESTRADGFESAAEHEIILDLLDKLENDSVFDEKWKAEFLVLKGEVERHVEKEELEVLPLMEKVFSEADLSEMAIDMRSLKALVQDTAFAPPMRPTASSRGGRPEIPPSI